MFRLKDKLSVFRNFFDQCNFSIEYVPRAKWRRGWHKLKTLVRTFTILSYARNFLLIFLSRIVTQSPLYIFEI